jgi:Tfp pilus assembly protein PilF
LEPADDPSIPPTLPLIERLQFVQRQTTLLIVLCVIAAAAFFLTRSLAGASRALHRSDAARWNALGQQRLADGDVTGAITALRRAAAMDHDARDVQLSLAAAHHQAGQVDFARDVLLAAHDRFPDDPDVSLRLATLEAASGRTDEAIRHYQGALLGLWGPEQLDRRRRIRQEYIEFLLGRGLAARALSETLLLAGEIPDDAASQVLVGDLLKRAGDPERALQHFESALAGAPRDPDVLGRAGEAAFEIGNYRLANRYLARAPNDPRSQALLPVVELVIALDPLRPGLALRERHRRLARAAALLDERITNCRAAVCPNESPCAAAEALVADIGKTRIALGRSARQQDTVEPGLSNLIELADRSAVVCGPLEAPRPVGRALKLIAAQYGGAP